MKIQRFSTAVVDCSRCRENHAAVEINAFELPVRDSSFGKELFSHWAMCPTKNEPIMVMVGYRLTPAAESADNLVNVTIFGRDS